MKPSTSCLKGTPRNVSLADVRQSMQQVQGVSDVHDLHVWSLGSNSHVLASHVTVDEISLADCTVILGAIQNRLWDRHRIAHSTIQFETCPCETGQDCCAPPEAQPVEAANDHHHVYS